MQEEGLLKPTGHKGDKNQKNSPKNKYFNHTCSAIAGADTLRWINDGFEYCFLSNDSISECVLSNIELFTD